MQKHPEIPVGGKAKQNEGAACDPRPPGSDAMSGIEKRSHLFPGSTTCYAFI